MRTPTWNTNGLPNDFPRRIDVKLQSGTHKGQKQLWAPFTHKGQLYKLVISQDPRRFVHAEAGETWQIKVHSNYERIVFCRPSKMLITADGKHPVEAMLRRQVDNGCAVSISAYHVYNEGVTQKRQWRKVGRLTDFAVDEATILMSFADVVLRGEDGEDEATDDFLFEVPVTSSDWFNLDSRPECHLRGGLMAHIAWAYLVEFWQQVHDRGWYLGPQKPEASPRAHVVTRRDPDLEAEEFERIQRDEENQREEEWQDYLREVRENSEPPDYD